MTITSDFQSTLSQLSGGHIKDNLNINGAISTKTVKRTVDNAVEKTKNAIVVLLDLNSAIEKMLNKHGIKEVPVMSAIKDFFVKKEAQVEGKLELWRQEYSTLLNAYVNKLETPLDINITSMKIDLALKNDCIIIGLEAKVQSEKQYFTIEGWPNDAYNMHIVSNKEFKILNMSYHVLAYHSMVNPEIRCQDLPSESNTDFNITNICDWNSKWVQSSLTGKDCILRITVQTKHGGVITIEKDRWKE